jgi:soluble lytic murein transglycosylase
MSTRFHLSTQRIVYRKNHLWFSELLGVGLAGSLMLLFLTLGIMVVVNEYHIRKNSARITNQKAQVIEIRHTVQEIREKSGIAVVLQLYTRKRLSNKILWGLADLVYTNSKMFGYDPMLLLAVIHTESMFKPEALGQYRNGQLSGAMGLMQLKFETAREVAAYLDIDLKNKEELFSPEINIPLGVAYLTKQISGFKSFKLGILAYNQGPGFIHNSLKNNIPLSINYYKKVLTQYYKLKESNQLLLEHESR